jgi:hypothetical protein
MISSGAWVRGEPVGTIAQPSEDNPLGSGTFCFFTGQGAPGGDPNASDLDRGRTTLLSPVFDAASDDMVVSYAFWFHTEYGGFFGSDAFEAWISNNGGMTWKRMERVTERTNGWAQRRFRVADVLEPTASMRLRFVAMDEGPRSLVEAAVDDVVVAALVCSDLPGDHDGDGFVELSDYQHFPSCFSGPETPIEGCLVFDAQHDDDVDLRDFVLIQRAFTGSP